MDEEFIEKEKGLIVNKDLGDSYPTVLIDAFNNENDDIVLVTVLKFEDCVVQYHIKLDSDGSKDSLCDVFLTDFKNEKTYHHKTVYCETYPVENLPVEITVGQA